MVIAEMRIRMIKGITKQIIEIKCNDSEYFDKILLFVSSDKYDIPREILKKQASEYSERYRTGHRNGRFSRHLFQIVMAVIAFMIMVAAVILALTL